MGINCTGGLPHKMTSSIGTFATQKKEEVTLKSQYTGIFKIQINDGIFKCQ